MRYLDLQVPSTDAEAVLQTVSASVAGIPGVDARHSAPGQVTVTETWRPLWTYLLAVLLFPVGLAALLVTRRAALVLTAAGRAVRVSGRGHEHVCDRVLAAVHRTTAAGATTQLAQ